MILAVALILFLPIGLGSFFAQVIAIVALYVLAGLGLNITLGLAGLLDLGFVAFFAVGAYTVGLLTSTAEYGIAQWSFWAAVPFAVILAALFGAFLGLPILGIRGDYLAIATLGFGEIIRILAGSDLLKPILGGPRGIVNIPKPFDVPPDHWLSGPNQIYYIALACAVVIAFVAWRLRGSRLGRAWIADPRGRGRRRGARDQPDPDQDARVHAGRRIRRPRRRDLRVAGRLDLPEQHPAHRLDQRRRDHHRRRHGQHPRRRRRGRSS